MVLLTLLTYLAYVHLAPCEAVVKKDSRENLIQLRDYDFVGEDKNLASILSERMAALAGPVDMTDLDKKSLDELNPEYQQYNHSVLSYQPKIKPKPDNLELNLRRYPKVNVSMDYGQDIFNTDISIEVNSSWLPYGIPTLNLTGFPTFNVTGFPGQLPANLTDGHHIGNLTSGRRNPEYWDPSYWEYNMKVIEIMKQNIYSVQNRLIEIEPIIQKYQQDERFRIAYIFNRLDEWKRNIRTVYHAMMKYRYYHMIFKMQLWYYEHMLRINIDITYSVEFLIHLHGAFMQKMEEIMPRADRDKLRQAMKIKQEMNTGQFRPVNNAFGG